VVVVGVAFGVLVVVTVVVGVTLAVCVVVTVVVGVTLAVCVVVTVVVGVTLAVCVVTTVVGDVVMVVCCVLLLSALTGNTMRSIARNTATGMTINPLPRDIDKLLPAGFTGNFL
jgi:hypothetical protein